VPRVLVADDNANIQKMVALALEERGIDVVSVGNGEAAVRRIPDLAPDLVLADVFMPVRNGYEVCEFVKTNQRFSHVPVILLVGAFDPLDEKEARRVGADGVLKKPFVPPDPLIAMVTSALEKNPKAMSEAQSGGEPAKPQRDSFAPVVEAPPRIVPPPIRELKQPPPEIASDDEPPVYGFEKANEKSVESFTPRFSSREMQQPEDDFDDTVTASDWRRNAANFEVPEDLNGKMAVTPDEAFDSAAFPSEHDAPPKRVPIALDGQAEEAPASAFERDSKTRFSGIERDSKTRFSGLNSDAADMESPTGYRTQLEPDAAPQPAAREEQPASPAREVSLPLTAAPGFKAPEPDAAPQPAVREEQPASPAREVSVPSSAADVLPSPSEYADDGWMSSLLGKFRRNKPQQEEKEEQKEETVQPAASSSADSSGAVVAAEPLAAAEPEIAPESEQPKLAGPRADETQDQFRAPEAPLPESWFAPHPPMLEEAEPPQEAPSTFSTETMARLLAAPADVTEEERSSFPVASEPTLVEREAAPEADEPQYAAPTSELADADDADSAAHPFFASSTEEETVDHNSTEYPATRFVPSPSVFPPPTSDQPAIESAAVSAESEEETSERIPTAPPPNREALREIPFLTPPPPAPFTPASSRAKVDQSGESPSVDAVVNRLLERLEPQLHEMLAKDLLKPLVENLLNQELPEKK
jgi:CheY-like chemotaxis protein